MTLGAFGLDCMRGNEHDTHPIGAQLCLALPEAMATALEFARGCDA